MRSLIASNFGLSSTYGKARRVCPSNARSLQGTRLRVRNRLQSSSLRGSLPQIEAPSHALYSAEDQHRDHPVDPRICTQKGPDNTGAAVTIR